MRSLTGLFAALCVAAATGGPVVSAAADPNAALIASGHQAFQYHCAPCHSAERTSTGRMMPGTEALLVKYGGREPDLLEQRTDLTTGLVEYVIRHGIHGMPFFRKTELSDAEMNEIAAYLTRDNGSATGTAGAAAGDAVTQGKRVFAVCAACHRVGRAAGGDVGPDLFGVVGRPAASVSGFHYSTALKSSGITWTKQALEQWLAGPSHLVPGTTMTFAGLSSKGQIDDVVAYLASLK
jgi:cytochrome c